MHLASKWARLEDLLDPGPLSVEGGIWGGFLRGGLSWNLEESWKGGSRGKGGFAEAPEARRGAEVVREVRPERLTPKGLDFLLQTPERTWEGGPRARQRPEARRDTGTLVQDRGRQVLDADGRVCS